MSLWEISVLLNLRSWVDDENDTSRIHFRQAVHILLMAIAGDPTLSSMMIMKGGVLLAIRYGSDRFTKDVDFSTQRTLRDSELQAYLDTLRTALKSVSYENEYDLSLELQSHQLKPKSEESHYPTLQMKVGYARKSDRGAMRRLAGGQASDVVAIDYSFNEWASDIEEQPLENGTISMYPFHDLVAEKLRSVLQQVVRNRSRFQDIYDLGLLFDSCNIGIDDRSEILGKLIKASSERDLEVHKRSMDSEELRQRSRARYHELEALIGHEPPPFEAAYERVRAFFVSLPWDEHLTPDLEASATELR